MCREHRRMQPFNGYRLQLLVMHTQGLLVALAGLSLALPALADPCKAILDRGPAPA